MVAPLRPMSRVPWPVRSPERARGRRARQRYQRMPRGSDYPRDRRRNRRVGKCRPGSRGTETTPDRERASRRASRRDHGRCQHGRQRPASGIREQEHDRRADGRQRQHDPQQSGKHRDRGQCLRRSRLYLDRSWCRCRDEAGGIHQGRRLMGIRGRDVPRAAGGHALWGCRRAAQLVGPSGARRGRRLGAPLTRPSVGPNRRA
jgi:hypothetical protein